MTNADLLRTHHRYAELAPHWRFRMAAYEGVDALLAQGVLPRHERESEANHRSRMAEAVGFNYSRSVVNLFTHYLFEQPARRELGALGTEAAWRAFADDCDYTGLCLETFLVEQARYASVYGQVGILVDMPPARSGQTLEPEDADSNEPLRPYLAAYHPEAILDWAYERDERGRPALSMVKLREEDGTFLLWTRQRFERWALSGSEAAKAAANIIREAGAVLLAEGENPLGEVPFVFLLNLRSRQKDIGLSDIADIARLDASIVRNLSQGEEVVKYAAFPMMRKPYAPIRPMGARPVPGPGGEVFVDEAGVGAVLEFDPEHPEAKPDWLAAAVQEPIQAVLAWIERKTREIYRMANAGSVAGSLDESGAARSGVALRHEFQLLNTVLAAKADNLEEAERMLVYFWLAWLGRSGEYRPEMVRRTREFSFEDAGEQLNRLLSVNETLSRLSPTFRAEAATLLARETLNPEPELLAAMRAEFAGGGE